MRFFFKVLFLVLFLLLFKSIEGKEKKPLNIAISSVPSNLSPFFSTDSNSQNINRLLHISLLDTNSEMNITCNACERYSEKIIAGKHHIRFTLKRNLKFWDGEPLTAEHVKKSWYYYTDKKNIKSIFRFAFDKIRDVKIYDQYEVELIYGQFDLENLSNLALFKILKMVDGKIIGAGPYYMENKKVLKFKLVPKNKIKNNPLIFKVVKDETTLALKLIKGEIDLSLAKISPRKYEWLRREGKESLSFWITPSSNYAYININHQRLLLKDVNVRKALSLLIPRKDLLKYKLHDTAILAKGIFSPAFEHFFNDPQLAH